MPKSIATIGHRHGTTDMLTLSTPSTNTNWTSAYADIWWKRGSVLETVIFNRLLENTVYEYLNQEVQLHKNSRETTQHGMQCIPFSFTYCLLSFLVLFSKARSRDDPIPPISSGIPSFLQILCSQQRNPAPVSHSPLPNNVDVGN